MVVLWSCYTGAIKALMIMGDSDGTQLSFYFLGDLNLEAYIMYNVWW